MYQLSSIPSQLHVLLSIVFQTNHLHLPSKLINELPFQQILAAPSFVIHVTYSGTLPTAAAHDLLNSFISTLPCGGVPHEEASLFNRTYIRRCFLLTNLQHIRCSYVLANLFRFLWHGHAQPLRAGCWRCSVILWREWIIFLYSFPFVRGFSFSVLKPIYSSVQPATHKHIVGYRSFFKYMKMNENIMTGELF